MANMFEAAIKGYTMMDSVIKEARGYQAAKEEFGVGPASDPELFTTLRGDERQQAQLEINQQEQDRRERVDTRSQQVHDREIKTYDETRDEDGMLKFVTGLRDARDKGGDIGEAFDEMADILPNIGVDPEALPALRKEVVDNPELLDQIYKSLADPVTAARVAKASGGGKNAPSPEQVQGALLKLDGTISRIDTLASSDNEAAGRSVFGMPGLFKAIGQGGFGFLGAVPGQPASDYVVDLVGLEGDIRSQAFETLKGGGQITEKESEFAAQAIANLSRQQSWESYQEELQDVRAYMSALRDAARRRAGGEYVPELLDPSTNENYPSTTQPNTIYIGHVDPETGRVFQGGDPGEDANWSTPE